MDEVTELTKAQRARAEALMRAGVADDFAGLSDKDALLVIRATLVDDPKIAGEILALARGEMNEYGETVHPDGEISQV